MENNKIPTAEEFLYNEYQTHENDDISMLNISLIQISQTLIDFAKLHVKAALEAAAENAKISNDSETIIRESVYKRDVYGVGEDWTVNKKSILEAYPLNQIV